MSGLFADDFFDRFLADIGAHEGKALLRPAVDVTEEEGSYTLVAELPGVAKDDVDIQVHGGVLTLSGERRDERDEEDDGARIRERSFGRFERAFRLPEHVDADGIEASLSDGVLTVTVPKAEAVQPRQIEVNV